ncbi:alpha-galactosidase [Dyella sp. Tek66A03]|uniref:alpha-galactosidase n=1 Tax=Dyella sp. Tek66A03 TaxID=3458298 RepID=UPI00403E89D7
MKPEVKDILTRREVIAVDQDPLGKQGTRAYTDGEVEVWTKPLSHGGLAVAIFNVGDTRFAGTHPFLLDLKRLGLHGKQQGTDLWTGKAVSLDDHQAIGLASHDVWLVRIDAPHAPH